MEALYDIAGTSRQAFHRWLRPSQRDLWAAPGEAVLEAARQVRNDILPGQGARKLHFYMCSQPDHAPLMKGWGKHRFEALYMSGGLRLLPRRALVKTTCRGQFVFPNLIEGKQLDNINQVWDSDMCYVFYGTNLLGYATTVKDVYSRFLLALGFSQTMRAEDTTLPALYAALQFRSINVYQNLVFHSDGGKQYIQRDFLQTLNNYGICSSMARNALENPFAEKLNDIIKNEYLQHLNVNSFAQLQSAGQFIFNSYNYHRPHENLKYLTPFAFEEKIATLQPDQRTKMIIKVIS